MKVLDIKITGTKIMTIQIMTGEAQGGKEIAEANLRNGRVDK